MSVRARPRSHSRVEGRRAAGGRTGGLLGLTGCRARHLAGRGSQILWRGQTDRSQTAGRGLSATQSLVDCRSGRRSTLTVNGRVCKAIKADAGEPRRIQTMTDDAPATPAVEEGARACSARAQTHVRRAVRLVATQGRCFLMGKNTLSHCDSG